MPKVQLFFKFDVCKDGKVVAAMGCGGSLPANDEKICQAGIDAMKK